MNSLIWSVECGIVSLVCILGSAREVSGVNGFCVPIDNIRSKCLDVAIIGGGLGGTYTGYRLRNFGKRISIFEVSDRIGGRIFSGKIPTVEGTTVARKLFTENTNMSRLRFPPEEEEIYSIFTNDGLPLYTLTLDDFYSRYASREAYNYIREAGVWNRLTGQFGAHLGLTELVFPGQEDRFSDLKTIAGGFSRLPRRLLSRFLRASKRHKLYMNYMLVSIKGYPGNYRLGFLYSGNTNAYTDPAKRDSVERVDFPPFRDPYFLQQLNSVIDVHSQKIFLAYPSAWWKEGNENITHARSDLQSGFTYDWRTGTNGFVIHLPAFSDGSSNVALWRNLQCQGSTISGSMSGSQKVTTAVRDRVHSFMSRVYRIPESQIPTTVGGGMQLWDQFPYAAGYHYYKPGFRMGKTRDYILKPFFHHEVFIVGNSWWPNPLQAWSESVLGMVDLLMEQYL